MLALSVAQFVIDHGLSSGADFVELFVERQYTSNLNTLGDGVESIRSGLDFGVGIRLVKGSGVRYTYANTDDQDLLCGLIDQINGMPVQNAQRKKGQPLLNQAVVDRHGARHRLQASGPGLDFGDRSLEKSGEQLLAEKIEFLRTAHLSASQASSKIINTKGFCFQRQQQVDIFNSEGLAVSDERNYIRIGCTAIGNDGQQQATGSMNHGALKGWEKLAEIDATQMGEESSRQALVNLSAKPCPSGLMPVVIGPGFGGVIFHEACGHLLETTSVAKKASVFHDQMGELIANPAVGAVDDGLLSCEWGSINIDDEGMPTQRTQLIRNGVLENFLADRLGSEQTGLPRTGSGRRESYRYPPASRMRNTFITPGESSLEDMLSSMDRGIYAAKMGGGSVVPGTGEFNFAVTEGYYVDKGKIQYPVKAATLISTGPKVLKQISMVGQDFELASGMCGSVSGSVPTTVGQPSIKVEEILVGGHAQS